MYVNCKNVGQSNTATKLEVLGFGVLQFQLSCCSRAQHAILNVDNRQRVVELLDFKLQSAISPPHV